MSALAMFAAHRVSAHNPIVMKNSEIVHSNNQCVSMWKVIAGDRKGADLRDRERLSVCWADSPLPFWNTLFLNETISDRELLRVRLRMSHNYMLTQRHSGVVYICEDLLSGAAREHLDAIATSENLTFALDIAGMASDILPLEGGTPHPKLDFACVKTETALQAYADIISEGYGFPLEAGRAGLAECKFWKKAAFAHIGYENGEPVSTAAAILNDGQIYLALVATRPDAQRKEFARQRSAMRSTPRTTQRESRGPCCTPPTRAFPVCQRVGYRRTAGFETYKPV